MRSNKKVFLVIIALTAIFTESCKKSFFTDVNKNPNAILTVSPSVLLSTTEAALGYSIGGDYSRVASYFDQTSFGLSQQSQTYYQYGITNGVFDNLWANLYVSTMVNDYTLKNLADGSGDNEYSGVSRILLAYSMQMTVDAWGKVPYSQAFQADLPGGVLYPVYDDDKALYDSIASLVDVGITYLNDANPGAVTPGSSDDVIYGGDESEWIKFGHAIKARLYIHQSKGSAAMATNALTEAALSFTANADNAQYIYGSTETTANPWYQMNEQRPGYVGFSSATLASIMSGLSDPRYPIYYDPANDGLGGAPAPPATPTHYSSLNVYYGSISSPTEFITNDELLFIKAEATLRATGDVGAAQAFYQAAITADMTKLGVGAGAIATYLTANGTLSTTVATAIGQVALQEYIALFLNPEAWTTWRRTAVPALTPVTGTAIPRRFLYPQNELNYNAANVPSATLFSPPIFWDN